MARDKETPGVDLDVLSDRTIELMDKLDISITDSTDVAMDIALRLAGAETPEALFDEFEGTGWRDRLGVLYNVLDIKYLRSALKNGPGIYALVEVADAETGTVEVLTCGSVNVIFQLARGKQMGWLDRPVALVESPNETANGGRPLRLIRP